MWAKLKAVGAIIKNIFIQPPVVEEDMAEQVTVGVKPWWDSKINWSSIFGMVAPWLVMFGFDVPHDFWTYLTAVMVSGQNLFNFIMRTWFTTRVTPQSVG